MTIRNVDAFMHALWDWSILKGCFGSTKIEPTDIDGFVERNGYFLVLEAKAPHKPLSTGQRISFEALQKTGLVTIIVIWGETNVPEKLLVMSHKTTRAFDPANLTTLRALVADWFMYTHRHRKHV